MTPRHGDMRGGRQQTTPGPAQVMYTTTTGQGVYPGPLWTKREYVCERFCAPCAQWYEVRGIVGVLAGCPVCQAPWTDDGR
jgi:hypothetical protein